MQISILDMGKTKKRNVRESIISVLSREYPLSIRKIYNIAKKEYKLDVTYQAVFKLVKEMLGDNILETGENKMEYKLNMNWIIRLEEELNTIKKKYLPSQENNQENYLQKWITSFVSDVGPKVKAYLGKDPACIIGVNAGGKGGGRLYASALWRYLTREGLNLTYADYELIDETMKKELGIKKKDVENRKVIVVDSANFSGRTYDAVMSKLNKFKKEFRIKELKYAVDKDEAGLADFCRLTS